MLWVKRQPCCAGLLLDDDGRRITCHGPVEADHAGRRGLSQKSHDLTCIPLCLKHHRERDTFHGDFKAWDHDRMRMWLDEMIRRYTEAYMLELSKE